MLDSFRTRIKAVMKAFNGAFNQLKLQSAYEIKNVSACQKTGQHLIEIKVTGKSQSFSCLAEEIVVDNNFLMGFPASDIRTITYLATSDRYEAILREEKIKKCYEVIRGKNRSGNKSVQLRHIETNEYISVSLSNFANNSLIDQLNSHDAYHLGYLAGQEQTWKDCVRLKLITSSNQDHPHE